MRKASLGKDLDLGDFLAFDIPSYEDNLGFDKTDSDEDSIDTPAHDYAEYQKKQAALMQRRRSSANYNRASQSQSGGRKSIVGTGTRSRAGSMSSESSYQPIRSDSIDYTSRRKSSVSSPVEASKKGSESKPSLHLGVPKGVSFVMGKRLSVALPTTSETDNEDEDAGQESSTSQTPEDTKNITTLEEAMAIPSSSSSSKAALKSKKYLVTSVPIVEKSAPLVNIAILSAASKKENALSAIKDTSPSSTASRRDLLPPLVNAESSISSKNDELKEPSIRKALSGVVPMGYHELKALSLQVSSLTHRLRMHHDEFEISDLIADERDPTLSIDQSLGELHSASLLEMEQNSPPNYEKNRRKVENALFSNVESCQLPTKLSPSELMRNHCSSKLNSILKPAVMRAWLKCLQSKPFEKLLRQMFWYIWHAIYKQQQGQEILETLLADISIDYVGLLISISVPRKDYFFVKLQDFISFCLVRLFEDSFPESTELSEAAFKSDVCSKVCVLLSGIAPSYLPSASWEKMAETIQVKATKTEDAKEQKRRALTQILTSAKCLDDPVSLDEKVIDKEFVIVEKQTDSSYFGDMRKAHNVNFNLYQNSPLVSQYLQQVSKKKKVVIKRIEICKDEPAKHLRTYRDIIEESKKDSKKRKEEFRRNQERIMKDRFVLSI